MNAKTTPLHGLHYHPVIVRPEPEGQFTARPLGVPEIEVVAATPQEAVQQTQRELAKWNGSFYWVPIQVPSPTGQPPLDLAGHAKDDPDFDLYLEEIERYRQEVDDRECSDSSSTPTT